MPRVRGGITHKQRAFAKKYVANGGNGLQAALAVYDTNKPNHAKTIASHNLEKPVVMQAIKEIVKRVYGYENEDNYIGDKLLKALESGITQKATNSDAIRVLELLLKINNSLPATKHVSMSYSEKVVSQPDFNNTISRLEKLQQKTEELLADIKSNK